MSDNIRVPVEVRTYSLYPRQIAAINGFAIATTDGNVSAALRRILDEWAQLKNDKIVSQQVQEPA